MRRRIAAAIAAVAIGVLVLYAAPRSLMVSELLRDQEQRALDRSVLLVQAAIEHRVAAGGLVDQAVVDDLVAPDEQLVVDLPGGGRLETEAVPGDAVRAAAPLAGGGRVELRLASRRVDDRVRDTFVAVAVLGLSAAGVAAVLALIVSRRVARPFTDLADHAGRLDPDLQEAAPRSGLAEADRIAVALDRTRERVAQLVREEREFSANASHQLRTPLAALRLRVEDVSLWPETPPEVRTELDQALREVDRLSGTISDLLALARTGGLGAAAEIDLAASARGGVDRWQAAFAEQGRTLSVRAPAPAVVAASAGAVLQILDVLLENALVHGRGDVEVATAADDGTSALRVRDEGSLDAAAADRLFERTQRSAASPGEGIGLALARTLAGAVGARLRVVDHEPTTFELAFAQRRG